MSQVQKLIHGGALRLMIIFLVTHCAMMRKNKQQVAGQGSIPHPTDAVVLNKLHANLSCSASYLYRFFCQNTVFYLLIKLFCLWTGCSVSLPL